MYYCVATEEKHQMTLESDDIMLHTPSVHKILQSKSSNFSKKNAKVAY